MQHPIESCSRCEREAPPPTAGPEGRAEQGWTSYVGEATLVIDVPRDDSILPLEVVDAIRHHEGLVEIVAWPETKLASVREVHSHYAGLVCPDCQQETGWDYMQWMLWLTEKEANDER
jgi:hypothetical protein